MDISSLKNLAAYNTSLSLTNFLGGGKTGFFDNIAQSLLANSQAAQANTSLTDTSGVQITLSEDAQKLLAQGNTDSSGNSNVSGVQKTAQNFMASFFDQNGVDFSSLTDDAKELITGLQGVIADSGTTDRDMSTDAAEEKYNPDRKVYTLTGNGSRLRLAIDYDANGKPQKMSITDITGGRVETADITLTQSADGKATSINIDRTQKSYANGHMTTVNDIDPLNVPLYS